MIRKNNQFKKFQCLSPEDVKEDVLYSFSYNPEEQPLFEKFYKMKLNNLSDWSNHMKDILTTLHFCNISVFQELSRKGRFHFHGYIKINKILEFYIHDLAKLRHYGTYEIDKINNEDVWETYIHKQERIMKKYCQTHDMFYNISNFQ